MLSHELAVEQSEIPGFQARDKPGERHLGGVARAAEHAFTEKGAAELDAVEAADELACPPDLD
jgi:hypothetical protein